MLCSTTDLDYLAGRLHGRRSRLAEDARLQTLCQVQTNTDLAREIYPDLQLPTPRQFQRAFLQALPAEIAWMLPYLTRPGQELARWMFMRFEIENFKVLTRRILAGIPTDQMRESPAPLRRSPGIDFKQAEKAESLATLLDLLPDPLRQSAKKTTEQQGASINQFLFEAALDRGYFTELLRRTACLPGGDKDLIHPIVCQEVDFFHLLLVLRGRFFHNLPSASLIAFHVSGSNIPARLFATLLSDSDLGTVAQRVLGRVVDTLPQSLAPADPAWMTADPSAMEVLSWNRFCRLANQAFRRSHMGLGAVIGYLALRRIEATNLITLSEGIRMGLSPQTIRERMFPRTSLGHGHV